MTNQKNLNKDDRLTLNKFTQQNNDVNVNAGDLDNYRNKTVNNPATLLINDIPKMNIDSAN